jgi:hypothetical protein
MANSTVSKQLAKEISRLDSAALRRIVRLSPRTANAYLRVIERSGHDPAVMAAIDRYAVAAARAERHADDATRKVFAEMDAGLGKHLGSLPGKDIELLRREMAHRRAVLLDKPPTSAPADAVRRGAEAATRDLDLGAALLQRRFLDRVRQVAARGQKSWSESERDLIRGFRKLRTALEGDWEEGWEPVFAYLRRHAPGMAERVRAQRAAESAVEQVRKTGSVTAVRAAEEAARRARRSSGADLSKLKGLLGEAYVPRWHEWKLQVQGYAEIAQREAKALPGRWEVRPVVGGLFIDGAEAWDEAILLVNRDTNQVKLFLAAQYKVEKRVSALGQIENDVLRETATSAGRLPQVTFREDGRLSAPLHLTPMPSGKPSHRLLFNAEGGAVSATAIERLRATGITVDQLNLDVSVAQFEAVARSMLDALADVVQ